MDEPRRWRKCARCGAELGAASSACLKCLGRLILNPEPAFADPVAGIAEPFSTIRFLEAKAGLPPDAPGDAGPRFGDYQLVERIAQGGMGVVYKARQLSLDRWVAVKMILPGRLADEQAVRRFYKEAQAAAKLQHPHIVAVHEVGEYQGQHFYSMDYVAGESLAQKVRHYPLSAQQAAEYVKIIAAATHYAHERGVLHRDLKPSNVLIDAQGQPHITDFGLAKLMHEGSDLTLSGVVMGSPSYIAPEQAQGQSSAVSVCSDVYSLGSILYELVTGRPPFKGESASATLKLVIDADPISPRQMNPMLSRDLEIICLKCLEKEPRRRYASAQALAEDLGRYLNREPIRARAVGAVGKTWRWCHRKPALACAIVVGALLFVVGFTGVTWQWRRAEDERQMQRLRAYASDMRAADLAIGQGDIARATDLLDRYLPQRGEQDLRGLEWRYLWQHCRSLDAGGFRYPTIPISGDLSPDGQWLATSGLDGWIRVHDRQGKFVVRQPSGFLKSTLPEPVVAFAPRGSLVAAATTTNVLVWETRSWQLQRRLPCGNAAISFSPDGQYLACLDQVGLHLWSTKTWQHVTEPRECPLPNGPYRALVFTPDSAIVALGNRNLPGIVLWSLTNSAIVPADLQLAQAVSLAISPDGHWLAAGSVVGQVKVWNLTSLSLVTELPPHTPWSTGLAFSPDSRILATAGYQQSIHLWRAGTNEHLSEIRGHRGAVWWLRFSTDGQWLFSGSSDMTVRRWSPDVTPSAGRIYQLPENCLLLDMAARGTQARVLNLPGRAFEEWDLRRSNVLRRVLLTGDSAEAQSLQYSRLQGDYLISNDPYRGWTGVYDTRNGVRLFPIQAQTKACRTACVSPDGLWISATEMTNGLCVGGIWDLKTGQRRVTLADQVLDGSLAGNAAFSPDGKRLAYETVRHEIKIYRLGNGDTVNLPGHNRPLYALEFSPDGHWLASGSWDCTVRVWDAASGKPITPLILTGVTSLHFTPEGKTLVTIDDAQGSSRVWHIPTGTEMLGSRIKSPGLRRAVDSEGATLITGTPNSRTEFFVTSLPPLTEIDHQIQTRALIRIDSVKP